MFTLCYFFFPENKPAAKFYGPVEPAAALRSIKEAAKESGKPTLKQALTHSNPANPQKSTAAASKKKGISAQGNLDAITL